ncbi:MAG: NADP-dependent oxidoreductase [Candidatus Obscuribacterales bacterium]|nr:NADP-dependent oxidoreductase [Candidatus Obscuribacterales bacterium]
MSQALNGIQPGTNASGSRTNRQFRLKNRPETRMDADTFELATVPVPALKEGQALIRTCLLSLDPTNRIWVADVDQYMPPVQIGEVMRGLGIGQVVESKHPNFQPGQLVTGPVGWQDYNVTDGKEDWPFSPLPQVPIAPEDLAGAAGMTGLTAYFGVFEVAKLKAGETMVVSAAAGAVGSIVGQLGKITGCRVVGIAGSDEKCRWLTDELGFDAAINYKSADWKQRLIDATPNGIDVNFENVGGEIMQFVFSRLNLRSRVALCGLISSYNDANDEKTKVSITNVLMKRVRVEGFIITDYFDKFAEGTMKLVGWISQGKIKTKSTIVEGLENAPDAVNQLFDGGNVGKLLVRVSDIQK